MIECIFTIDYEIYGNGEGSLEDFVYEPTQKLIDIFDEAQAKMVVFVEVVELEKIEAFNSDPAIDKVKKQIKELHDKGHEIGLHLHPQWFNARYENGKWELDYSEYNLCALPKERIEEIVKESIKYLQSILGTPGFKPFSFRAGNWLFQPTSTAANVLAEQGIKIDSSVFKGGLQHYHKLDYRRSKRNGYYWKFQGDVNTPDPDGALLEIPIYTQLVPFWKMITSKRVGLQQKGGTSSQTIKQKMYRILDKMRLRYPLKLDFCRMTIYELTGMVDAAVCNDKMDPKLYRPLVAIGHTKDILDFETVDFFLSYLKQKSIAVTTFKKANNKINIEP